MPRLLLNTLALDPNRWTAEKTARYRLGELLPPLAEAGFPHLELWQYHVSREEEAGVRRLRAQADALGVQIPVVGLYPRLHLQGRARQKAWDEARRVFDYAGLLGAAVVKIFVGSQGTAAHTAADYERALAFLADLAALAGANGLTLTGETHPHTLFDTVAACRAVLKAVGSAHLKVCFQPFDFADTRQTLADYDALHAHILHVHYQGRRGGVLTWLEDADLDYKAFTAALAARGFDGYLCIELVKDSVVDDPAAFDLAQVLRHAQRDRDYVVKTAASCGMTISVGGAGGRRVEESGGRGEKEPPSREVGGRGEASP